MRTFQGVMIGLFLVSEIILSFCDIIVSCHILIFFVRDTLLMLVVVLVPNIEVVFPLPRLYYVFLHHHLHPICLSWTRSSLVPLHPGDPSFNLWYKRRGKTENLDLRGNKDQKWFDNMGDCTSSSELKCLAMMAAEKSLNCVAALPST